jgi:catechol 2,3-dioxygenase-like lactoylglutathione lyase family enzyme
MAAEFKSSRDVIIQSDKLVEAEHFYETVMGFKSSYRSENLLGFETGSFCLYVEKGSAHAGPVFEFYVPNLEAAKKKLLAAGCKVVEEDPNVPRCYMRDPFGLMFNLAEKKT